MNRFIKLLCLLLAVFMMVSLASCSESDDESEKKSSRGDSKGDVPEIGVNKINLEGVTKIGDIAEIELVRAFASADVKPPKPDSVYIHYEAENGEIYFVIVMDVKNISGEAVCAEDILEATLEIGSESFESKAAIEADDGASFDYASLTDIAPLETVRIYQLFSVPENSDKENLKLVIESNKVKYSVKFSMDSFKGNIKDITIGTEITVENNMAFTVESIEFDSKLYPPNATGYYHYFEAEDGKTYLIVKMSVKNFKGSDMKYSSVAGVSCVYDEKYNYSFFTVAQRDNGADLTSYAGQYYISPLDTGVVYYLAEVPEEVEGGPVEISLYVSGEYYSYKME